MEVKYLTDTSATINGTVNGYGLSTSVTFIYGTTTSYGSTTTAKLGIVTGSTSIEVSADITGLTCGTVYHFRVISENSCGTRYGDDNTFYFRPPTLSTTPISGITATTAISGGNITDEGCSAITDRGVRLGRGKGGMGKAPNIYWFTYTHDGTGAGNFTSNLTGLSPSTRYYVKSYATTQEGTAYGNVISFKTSP